MNPISKKIINKLSQEDKTELKSEKVELSLVSDFKTEYALAVKNSLSLTDEFSNIENKKQKLISKIKKNINQFKKIQNLIIKFLLQLKKLVLI
jgi:uncharacterized membrane protein